MRRGRDVRAPPCPIHHRTRLDGGERTLSVVLLRELERTPLTVCVFGASLSRANPVGCCYSVGGLLLAASPTACTTSSTTLCDTNHTIGGAGGSPSRGRVGSPPPKDLRWTDVNAPPVAGSSRSSRTSCAASARTAGACSPSSSPWKADNPPEGASVRERNTRARPRRVVCDRETSGGGTMPTSPSSSRIHTILRIV